MFCGRCSVAVVVVVVVFNRMCPGWYCRSIFSVTLRFMIKGVIFYEVIQLLSDLFITRNNLTPILISNTSLVSGYEGVNAMFCDFILNFAWNDFGMRDILWL